MCNFKEKNLRSQVGKLISPKLFTFHYYDCVAHERGCRRRRVAEAEDKLEVRVQLLPL